MEFWEVYSQAVAAYDKAKPYCIAQVQYAEEDEYGETARLVIWRRYSTKRKANSDPQIRNIKNYCGGLHLLHISEFEQAARKFSESGYDALQQLDNTACP